MIARRAFAIALLAGFACAQSADAQQPAAIVESEGKASVVVSPDTVLFEFTKDFTGPTLVDTEAQSVIFEKALTQALNDLDATPTQREPLKLTVPGLDNPIATAFIRVSYPMPEGSGPAGSVSGTPLVTLAEKIRKAGVSLLARVRFAGFEVTDRETPEQEAIARASENALYHAEAVGALLEGRVIKAERITIVETGWEGLQAKESALSVPPAVECFARVRISYQYSSSVR